MEAVMLRQHSVNDHPGATSSTFLIIREDPPNCTHFGEPGNNRCLRFALVLVVVVVVAVVVVAVVVVAVGVVAVGVAVVAVAVAVVAVAAVVVVAVVG